MALTVVVSKKIVSLQMPDLWNITLNMICIDVELEVINQDFFVRYRTGDDIATKEAKLQKEMQAAIDEYNAEQQIFDHTKLDTIVTNLNINLVG